MIYNFNLGIGWASSGVEYAQSYRAKLLRKAGIPAKFIFTDMFQTENIEHMTKNIGFEDSEIIWLYSFFTDIKTSPVTYTLEDFEKTMGRDGYEKSREGKIVRYVLPDKKDFYTAYMVDEESDRLHRVEYVSGGFLIRKDYFSYCRLFTEYYAPLDGKAHMYHRRFFNEDGSVAYEEINDRGRLVFRFPDRILFSKEELVAYLVEKLPLKKNDIVLIDRTTGIGQSILEKAYGRAKIGIVIHADHFSEGGTNDETILWNNYYEYGFSQYKKIDFYIASTDVQNRLLKEQLKKYMGAEPEIITIPVGSLDSLIYPGDEGRKPHSLITASRLADEKHIDWIIEAVCMAREQIQDLTLDIYGMGANEKKLKDLIKEKNASDYIRMMGQYDLTEIYKKYDAYIAGSMSEGFGLTLMEAIGSGLPIIGFDVRYGNPNFIEDGKNGILIPVDDSMDGKDKILLLKKAICRLFDEVDMDECHRKSYEKAEEYLTDKVLEKWKVLQMNGAEK